MNAAQIADTDNVYVGRPGDVDPDRRALISSLQTKVLQNPAGAPFYTPPATFTPTITATTTNPTVTYTTQSGRWHRIGNLVTVTIRIIVNTISGGSGALRISNLPVATMAGDGFRSVMDIAVEGVNWGTAESIVCVTNAASTLLTPVGLRNNNTLLAIPIANVSANDLIMISGSYWAA